MRSARKPKARGLAERRQLKIRLRIRNFGLAFARQSIENLVDGGIEFFRAIAREARGDDIALHALSTARQRDHVVKRQFGRRDFLATVVTNPGRDFRFPPRALTQLTRTLALTL